MVGLNIVFISITIMFLMFFIWLCTLSIRLSIAQKLITKLYEEINIELKEEIYDEKPTLDTVQPIQLPSLSLKSKIPY